MKTKFAALISVLFLIAACSSQNVAPYRSSQPVETSLLKLLPMAYVFPQTPPTVGILQTNGKIVVHPKLKNDLLRLDSGSWRVKGKRLMIKYKMFNALACEAQKDCSRVSKENVIELKLDEAGRVPGLRTFNANRVGFDQLYYNESVTKDAPALF